MDPNYPNSDFHYPHSANSPLTPYNHYHGLDSLKYGIQLFDLVRGKILKHDALGFGNQVEEAQTVEEAIFAYFRNQKERTEDGKEVWVQVSLTDEYILRHETCTRNTRISLSQSGELLFSRHEGAPLLQGWGRDAILIGMFGLSPSHPYVNCKDSPAEYLRYVAAKKTLGEEDDVPYGFYDTLLHTAEQWEEEGDADPRQAVKKAMADALLGGYIEGVAYYPETQFSAMEFVVGGAAGEGHEVASFADAVSSEQKLWLAESGAQPEALGGFIVAPKGFKEKSFGRDGFLCFGPQTPEAIKNVLANSPRRVSRPFFV